MTDIVVLPPDDDDKPHLPALSINELISQAIRNNLSVDALERILAMRRELRAEEAKEAFDESMRQFQGECPPFERTKAIYTNSGELAYCYTPLEDLVLQTQTLRSKHGFSYVILTKTLEKMAEATCVIKHVAGHQESSSFTVPVSAGTRIMSNSQITASALQFATRYAFRNALGLVTADTDYEYFVQKRAQEDAVTDEELAILLDLIDQLNIPQEEIIKRFKLDSLTTLKKHMYTYIVNKLTTLVNKRNVASPQQNNAHN